MPAAKTRKPPPKQTDSDLREELEQLKLDVACLTVHLLSQHGGRPALMGIIERHDPDRLAPERRPA